MRVEHIGQARLLCGDYRDILPMLEADAVISDPPYGIGYAHGGGGGKLARSTAFAHEVIVGDDQPFDPSDFLRFRTVVLWGANHFAERLPSSAGWLIWDKRDGICSNDQADCEIAWTNKQMPARVMRHLWNGMLKASERGESRVHPTQKPIAVMEWCVKLATVLGEMVLDPFMGSGTTGVACAKLGRKFIGIEIEPKYFDIACRRIEAAYKQPDLFIEKPKPAKQDVFL